MQFFDSTESGAGPREVHSDGVRLYFAGQDGFLGVEPWVSDGTEAGSYRLADISPGEFKNSWAKSFVSVGTVTYFVATDDLHGQEIWRTDGTAEGTQLVADVFPGAAGSFPKSLVVSGSDVYFLADDGLHGAELWVANHTGARLVEDIRPGAASVSIHTITATRGGVFFVADDGLSGFEPWRANRNDAERLADLFPGPAPSFPYSPNATMGPFARDIDGAVYFQAQSPATGVELWRVEQSVGDTNFDGEINLADLNNVRNHFGETGLGDADGDSDVDLDDLNLVRNHFGDATPAPATRNAATASVKLKHAAVDLLFGSEIAKSELVGPRRGQKAAKAVNR